MNVQSNLASRSFAANRAPTALSKLQPFLWCVRREIWENRSIYIAPLVAGGVAIIAFLFTLPHVPHTLREFLALSSAEHRDGLLLPFNLAAALILATTILVAFFYCLETLYGERRDRSILFWKSLPVSDLTAVLAKAVMPMIVIPIVGLLIVAATQWIMLILSSVVLLASGLSVTAWLRQIHVFHQWLGLAYHILTAHTLWYAPIYGWFLLASAWARRAPLLWAVLPPLAIGGLEKIAFNTTHFFHYLQYLFIGGPDMGSAASSGMQALPFDPKDFFSSPQLWIGLAVCAVFLYVAARLRRYRGPV